MESEICLDKLENYVFVWKESDNDFPIQMQSFS